MDGNFRPRGSARSLFASTMYTVRVRKCLDTSSDRYAVYTHSKNPFIIRKFDAEAETIRIIASISRLARVNSFHYRSFFLLATFKFLNEQSFRSFG